MAFDNHTVQLAQGFKGTIRRLVQFCLIVAGVFGLLRGVGYWPALSPDRLPAGLDIITTFIPIWFYSIVWVAGGLLCLVAAIRGNERGTAVVLGMSFMWAVAYTSSWLIGYRHFVPDAPSNRDYLGASVYWTIFLLLLAGRWLATVGYQATELLTLLLETRGRDEGEK